MRKLTRLAAGVTVLAVAGWLLVGSSGRAQQAKGPGPEVDQIAAAFAKGDEATAKKGADALAGKIDELGDVMDLMKPRKKGKVGLGVGKTPGQIIPDGIEMKLIDLDKNALTKGQLDKEAPALVEMAYRAAAITQVALAKPADAAKGKEKAWNDYAVNTRKSLVEFAKVVKGGDPGAVQKAANKVVAGCNGCHGDFR
jgi:hypothetical protein